MIPVPARVPVPPVRRGLDWLGRGCSFLILHFYGEYAAMRDCASPRYGALRGCGACVVEILFTGIWQYCNMAKRGGGRVRGPKKMSGGSAPNRASILFGRLVAGRLAQLIFERGCF